MHLTRKEDIDKANGNINDLASTTPMAKCINWLKDIKATRLHKNVVKWFSENKKSEDFSYRFTGKESKLLCWHFMKICKALIVTKGIPSSTSLHLYSLAYAGLCLRNSVSLFTRVHINDTDITSLKKECEQYYNCQAILLHTVKPTTWKIGKAIPYYTTELFNDLGFGLGLNSMQGREAKHAKLACYAKNTTKGKRLRWWQIFKHEFMELIWLKEKDHKQVLKKLMSTSKSKDDANQEESTKDTYIPPYCLDNDEFCVCGLSKSSSENCCFICSSDIFKLVKQTCQECKVNKNFAKFIPELRI
ncbi:uncharacterized protein LOC110249767 [Exaiptasia diaphana]|uniref:Uncharacterized protein n=1 Tax=Exaiptasia diaphana TaxID=2652724 RepID=A0A913XYX3_EXADI|nr:uncharacterized protein LOC110249767 [Exaiptasia diaphana]KXJ07867.1 hypothetical protein AC249_AIPGENE28947 [Exaiptasia diaphana]